MTDKHEHNGANEDGYFEYLFKPPAPDEFIIEVTLHDGTVRKANYNRVLLVLGMSEDVVMGERLIEGHVEHALYLAEQVKMQWPKHVASVRVLDHVGKEV